MSKSGYTLSGFWRRVGAFFIDYIVIVIFLVVTVAILTIPLYLTSKKISNNTLFSSPPFSWIFTILFLAIIWLYFAYFESSSKQATLGKQAVNILVTDTRLAKISFKRASVRLLFKFIFSPLIIGFLTIPFSSKKQAIHDMIAGTIVIKKETNILPLMGRERPDEGQNLHISDSKEQGAIEHSPIDSDARFEEGKQFERYVAHLFKNYYTIEDWTQDNSDKIKGFFVESNMNPDLTIRYNPTQERFAVECKWRSSSFYSALKNEKVIQVAQESQLSRYQKFSENKGIPVFIVLGVGGTPDNPLEVYCIPLNKISSIEMPISSLIQFKRSSTVKEFSWFNGLLK
jgi:uncharacterized RDD family membrane protein YckC/uncharacterized protein YutD